MIAIIDYGMGNKYSVYNALNYIGEDAVITNKENEIKDADRLILPGVGAFGSAMENLAKTGLLDVLNEEVLVKGKPFLGICLGMQMVAETGTEKGLFKGLGWVEGEVKKLEPDHPSLNLPHVGWNDIIIQRENPLFKGLKKELAFYFVHSYAFKAGKEENIAAQCDYGGLFTAAVQKNNIFATQFHPEKSQKNGLVILENFSRWRG